MFKISKKSLFSFLSLIVVSSFIIACEDEPPLDYIQETYVEAFLIVGEPIKGIRILYTQPIDKNYSIDDALVKNANVKILPSVGDPIELVYKDENPLGYYNIDSEYLVQANTLYSIEITMPDGDIITGSTMTPDSFKWISEPKDTLYFPEDTLKQSSPDSISISWEMVANNPYYIINVICLDTLEYGSYLSPPVPQDMNRRTPSIASESEEYYYDVTSTNFIGNNRTGIVWLSFKWFGVHEIETYCPDYNYLLWFMHTWQMDMEGAYYDPLYSSVEGAIGVFGSASVVRKNTFLKKPKILYK